MSSCGLMFPGVRSSLMFSGFGLKLLPLVFSIILTVASRLLQLSLPRRFPLFLASFVCWPLQCLISALTQGGSGGHFLRLTCSVVLWGGRNTANKQHWRVLTVSQPHWVCPRSLRVCFPCLHCLGSRLLRRTLSEASPGLHAPLRSKPLRFRHSGSPQRRRLGWA